LREWKLQCPRGRHNLVFPTGSGTVESLSNIHQRGYKPAQIAAGIVTKDGKPKYNFHALRHFYASWIIDRGFELKRAQELMGHASIKMTADTYAALFPKPADDFARLDAPETIVAVK